MNEEKLKKLKILEAEPNLAFFDELSELNEKLEALQGVLSDINIKEVKTYEEELNTLHESIFSLTQSVNSKDMVVNIPLDEMSTQLIKVESAIKAIGVFKETLIPEFPTEMALNDEQINSILASIEGIPEFPIKELEKMINSLGDKLKQPELETEEFDYDRIERKFNELVRAVKNMSITVSGGNGLTGEVYNKGVDVLKNELVDIKVNQINRTQETKLFDSWGDEIGSTMIDELMVSQKKRIAGGVFNGTTPDTNFYTTVVNSNGTATISNRIIDLATTTDSGSSVIVYTNAIGRFIGGSQNHLYGTFRPGDTGVANNTRQIGVTALSDLADSLYFQLSGTTFSIVANTTGLDQIKIDNGSFNGDATTYPITNTFHTWEIIFTNKEISFYIDKHLVHTLTETTFPICGSRHLRPFMRNTNTGVGSVTHLYASTLELLTLGETHTQSKPYYHEGQTTGILLKTGIGSIHSLIISGVVNNANVDIYDGISTAGTKIWSSGAMSNQTVPFDITFNTGDQFTTGLFIVKNGANCNTKIFYE